MPAPTALKMARDHRPDWRLRHRGLGEQGGPVQPGAATIIEHDRDMADQPGANPFGRP